MYEAYEFESEFGRVGTMAVPIESLPVGAVIVVPDVVVHGQLVNLLKQVTVDCASDRHGWLTVYDLGFESRGPLSPDDKGLGFFDFAHGTPMYWVVEADDPHLAALLQAASDTV